jgi:UDP:flavonoid glycosyltransferase YjiC (YdhE family)
MSGLDVIKNGLTSLITGAVFRAIDIFFHAPIFHQHCLNQPIAASNPLIIVNADRLMEWPRRLPHWVVHAGPLLPAEASRSSALAVSALVGDEDFLYVSLGTLSALDKSEMLALRAALNKLAPLRVIWKVSHSDLPADLSLQELQAQANESINIISWAPQNDLLASAKILGFLSHGGNNGLYEAAYHGVPVAAVPIIADQADNVSKFVANGIAVRIGALSEEKISAALILLLSDAAYRTRAQQISRILKNRPKALDVAVDWVEYGILTRGLPYATPGLKL